MVSYPYKAHILLGRGQQAINQKINKITSDSMDSIRKLQQGNGVLWQSKRKQGTEFPRSGAQGRSAPWRTLRAVPVWEGRQWAVPFLVNPYHCGRSMALLPGPQSTHFIEVHVQAQKGQVTQRPHSAPLPVHHTAPTVPPSWPLCLESSQHDLLICTFMPMNAWKVV